MNMVSEMRVDYTSSWINELHFPHHRQSVLNLRDEFIGDETVLALILGGSICHGYAREDSDIDCMFIVDEEIYKKRHETNADCYYSTHLTPYKGGYVDGKYQCIAYLEKVAFGGPEPARYAYKDARIIFSRIPNLTNLIEKIAAYPEEGLESRIMRFHAQLEGMRWFFGEGIRRAEKFTITWAAANMVLFGGRMILAHNRALFPCQKTMMHELHRCKELPEGIFDKADRLLSCMTEEAAEEYYRAVIDWQQWPHTENGWAGLFMADAELKWLSSSPSVAEI